MAAKLLVKRFGIKDVSKNMDELKALLWQELE